MGFKYNGIKKIKNKGFSITDLLIVLLIIGFIKAMDIPVNPRGINGGLKIKQCKYNQQILLEAVENYNNINKEKIEVLNEKTIDELEKGRFLTDKPLPPIPGKCNYLSIGNLTDKEHSFIYCEYHGNIEEIMIRPDMSWQEYLNELKKKKKLDEEKERKKQNKQNRDNLFWWTYVGIIVIALVLKFFSILNDYMKKGR